MENILNQIIHYSKYINWINLVLLYMVLLTFWNWVTLFGNFHKRASGVLEHYIRLLLPIPFWFIFLFYNINFLSPINFYSFNDYIKKEIIIDNNTNNELNIQVIGSKDSKYHIIFNNFDNYLDKKFTIEKNRKKRIELEIDTTIIDKIHIMNIDSEDKLFQYGKSFYINSTKLLLFGDEFRKTPIKGYKTESGYFYKLLLINIISIFASWYYYFLAFMKKNKRIFLIISSIVSLISIISIFFTIRIMIF